VERGKKEHALAVHATHIEGVRVGHVNEVDDSGRVYVDFPGSVSGRASARFTQSVQLDALRDAARNKREVLLVFENNDPARPIVVDVLHSFVDHITKTDEVMLETEAPKDVTIDGRAITFDAQEQITLRCGKASITLTKAGKIIIRGAYVLTRSSGVNKIKGASVQVN